MRWFVCRPPHNHLFACAGSTQFDLRWHITTGSAACICPFGQTNRLLSLLSQQLLYPKRWTCERSSSRYYKYRVRLLSFVRIHAASRECANQVFVQLFNLNCKVLSFGFNCLAKHRCSCECVIASRDVGFGYYVSTCIRTFDIWEDGQRQTNRELNRIFYQAE